MCAASGVTDSTPARRSGMLGSMGFVQLIQKDLEQALAEQQRVVLVQVLRRRIATMTFAELRELLASPLGKALGSVKVTEVLAVAAEVPARSSSKAAATKGKVSKAKPTKKSKPTAKKPAKKAKTKPVKKKPQATPAASAVSGPSETPAAPEAAGVTVQAPPPASEAEKKQVKKTGKKQAKKQGKKVGKKQAKKAGKKPAKKGGAGKAASNTKSPPGMSAEQAAEMARYNASVLALVREAGGWVTSSALHEKSGGSINQLRLALHKLVSSGEIVREGERGNTRYRIAAK